MVYRQAKARTDEEKKEIYDKWNKLINMSQKALDDWAENDHRLLASINRNEAKDAGGIQSGYDSFHRIKRRKKKPFKDWSAQDFDNASQENGFNSRMLGGKPGEPIGGSGMSKWEISLRNWGHDPSLKSSPQHAKWKAWKEKHMKKANQKMTALSKRLKYLRKIVLLGKNEGSMSIQNLQDTLEEFNQESMNFLRGNNASNPMSLAKKGYFKTLNNLIHEVRKIWVVDVIDNELTPKDRDALFKRALVDLGSMYNMAVDFEKSHLRNLKEKFTYEGFRVESHNISSFETSRFLDAVDYLKSIFEKRDMTDVIYESINKIVLKNDKERGVLGSWDPVNRVLSLSRVALTLHGGKQLENFVKETLIHEIGHWVHLNYITKEARKFWDSGWEYIDEREDDYLFEKMERETIGSWERPSLFEKFVEAQGDLKKLKKSLSPLDQIKVHQLLTAFSDVPYMTPKQFRLNSNGKKMVEILKNPSVDLDEFQRIKQEVFKIEGFFEDVNLQLDGDKLVDLFKEEEELHHQAIAELKNSLGIPTNYGRTSVTEDFAETFVLFLIAPERLSDTARWRMGRTLGLSEATGKKVMRVAKRVAERYLQRRMK